LRASRSPELLLEHYLGDQAEAQAHIDFALAEFRDLRMPAALERRHRRQDSMLTRRRTKHTGGIIGRVYPGLIVPEMPQPPNQRSRLDEANSPFSAAVSSEGPVNGATTDGPVRKSASTRPTLWSPNSM